MGDRIKKDTIYKVKEADPAFSSLVLGFSPSGLEGRRIEDVIPGFYEEFEVLLLNPPSHHQHNYNFSSRFPRVTEQRSHWVVPSSPQPPLLHPLCLEMSQWWQKRFRNLLHWRRSTSTLAGKVVQGTICVTSGGSMFSTGRNPALP